MKPMLRNLLLFAFAAGLRADVLFDDDFNHDDGPLTSVASATWAAHSGTAGEILVAGGAITLDEARTEDVNAKLAGGPYPANSPTELYLALRLRFTGLPSGQGAYFAHFKDGGSTHRARLFASTNGAPAGQFRLGIARGGSTPTMLETDLALEQTFTAVVRYEMDTVATTLWIDPADETAEGVNAVDNAAPAGVAAVALRQSRSSGNGMGTLAVESVRVATSFTELVGPVVEEAPSIAAQPKDASVAVGAPATFSVSARGTGPLSYQWQHARTNLAGATDASLTLSAVTTEHAGAYRVVVSNRLDAVISDEAWLTVTNHVSSNPPTVRFTNVLSQAIRPGDAPTNTFAEYGVRPGEHLRIEVHVSDAPGVVYQLMVEPADVPDDASGRWTLLPPALLDLSGDQLAVYEFAPRATDAGQVFHPSLTAWNAAATNRIEWTLYVPTMAEQRVVIAEYLANPATDPAAPHFNPLHRADVPSQNVATFDEYLELVNLSAVDLDLQGWSIADAMQVRHRFQAPFTLSVSNAVVVFGGPEDGFAPVLEVPAFPASEGTAGLALNNGGDTVVLRNAAGHIVERLVYTSRQVSSAGSMTRCPTLNDDFMPQAEASITACVTPGTQADGRAWNEAATEPEKFVEDFAGALTGDGAVRLTWQAVAGASYSVEWTTDVKGGWNQLTSGLVVGECIDTPLPGTKARFYRIRSP